MYQHEKDYQSNLETFWNACDPTFAHIKIDKWLKDQKILAEYWEKTFLRHIDLHQKSVIDYGIGGGFLGKYLFEAKSIKKYTGIDISERSLEEAKNNLKDYAESISLLKTPVQFKSLNADIFISIACIQHFPNKSYLDDFLKNLVEAEIPEIALQVRIAPELTFFQDNPIFSCWVNLDYLKNALPDYSLRFYSEIEPNQYQYFIFTKNKTVRDLTDECKNYTKTIWTNNLIKIAEHSKIAKLERQLEKSNSKNASLINRNNLLKEKNNLLNEKVTVLRDRMQKITQSKRYKFAEKIAELSHLFKR